MSRKRPCPCALRLPFSWLAAFVAVLWTFSVVPNLSAQEPEISSLATALSKSISASGSKRAAVVDFTDLQGCVTEFGRSFAEDLSVALAGDARGFEVIDRTDLKVILQEHHLASTGIIDPETVRKLGQIAGVDTLVSGTIAPLGDVIHISTKALNTNTARIIGGITIDIPRTEGVDALLAKDVSNCRTYSLLHPNADNELSNGEQAPQSLNASGSATFQMGDFTFSLLGCGIGEPGMQPNQVKCRGTVTNTSQEQEAVSIGANSYIVDDTGRQARVALASFGRDTGMVLSPAAYNARMTNPNAPFTWTLDPEIPIQFFIYAGDFSSQATSVTVVFEANGHRATLRSIRLQGR